MKDVTENDEEEEEEEKAKEDDLPSLSDSDFSNGSKGSSEDDSDDDPDKNKEITSMQLIWEDDYIMMVCTDSKYLYVYDEDDVEESVQIRKIVGAHTDEISILKYNDHLSLLATGAVNGEIVVWDFEMSKVEGYCLGHTEDITGIEFLAPNPIMVTSSMDCTVCIWGVRPVHIDFKYQCLYRFNNNSWNFDKDLLTPVTRTMLI